MTVPSPSTSMGFCIALAVRDMGMTVAEAVRAATRGGAEALQREDLGRLSPGSRADAIVLDAASPVDFVYRPGVPLVYLPAMSLPDPEVKRKSGLLVPEINISSLRGLSYEQPYLQVISPSEDLVITIRDQGKGMDMGRIPDPLAP